MTKRVTALTKFKNNFYHNGQMANRIIREAGDRPVWQRIYDDGSIGILSSGKDEDIFTLINPNGTILEKFTNHYKSKGKNRIAKTWESIKIYWNALGEDIKTISVQKYFHGGHLEEKAEKIFHGRGPVSVRVDSFANRHTEFPQTGIAKNLRPAVMDKYEHIDGSTTYIEFHPLT